MAERIKINYPANELFAAAVRIVKKVRKAGFEMFFVGGAVRDLVLGRTPSDIDMVTTALPQDICDLCPYSEMVGACFGVVLVKQDGFVFAEEGGVPDIFLTEGFVHFAGDEQLAVHVRESTDTPGV